MLKRIAVYTIIACLTLVLGAVGDTVVHPQNLFDSIVATLTVTNTLTVTSGITPSNLTASQLVTADSSKKLVSNGAMTTGCVPKSVGSGATIDCSHVTDSGSLITVAGPKLLNGDIQFERTNIAAGTSGNATIDKPAGCVNMAAGAATLTVTNSLVTTSSGILVSANANDATCSFKRVTKGAGSFQLAATANCTAETQFCFLVTN